MGVSGCSQGLHDEHWQEVAQSTCHSWGGGSWQWHMRASRRRSTRACCNLCRPTSCYIIAAGSLGQGLRTSPQDSAPGQESRAGAASSEVRTDTLWRGSPGMQRGSGQGSVLRAWAHSLKHTHTCTPVCPFGHSRSGLTAAVTA